MAITIKSLGYGKVAVLHNGKHVKTFTGMSAPNDARQWVANQYKASEPDSRTGSPPKNENTHLTAADIYRQMQEGNQEKIDANKNGKIDSEDFKILRSKKKDTCEADCKESVEHLEEKLTADQPVSKWIEDFVNSDNPKFAGKSKEERRQMALGAYYAAKRQNEDVELDEGTLMVSRHRSYARPGQGPEAHPITKDHGEASDGSRVYSVKQPNGFHGVLAVKGDTVVGSSRNNLSKDEAHKMGDHYVKHGTVGIGVGKHWSIGSGIHGKVVKEDVELDEASYEKDMDEKKPVFAQGVKGVKSKPFTKKFKTMDHYNKWADSEASEDHEVHRVYQESVELEEAIDNGPKGRVKTDDIKYGQTRNMTGYTASKGEMAQRRAEQEKEREMRKAPAKTEHAKSPKHIDPTSRSVHRALEDHLGGTFEHYESTPKKGHVTLPDGRKAAAMDATVTHSYNHEDLGIPKDEMPDTAETYHIRLIKHPDHGYVVHHRSHRLGESVEIEEDTQSELGSHPEGYEKVGQRWKKAQKQDQQGKPEKSYEYADKPATGLTKEDLTFSNMDFTGEIVRESIEVVMNSDTTSYDACFHLVKHMMQTEDIDLEFLEAVDQLYQNKAELFEIYTRYEVEQRVAQHKKTGNKVSDVRYSIKQGQPYAEYVVTQPDGTQRKYIYHGSVVKHERM